MCRRACQNTFDDVTMFKMLQKLSDAHWGVDRLLEVKYINHQLDMGQPWMWHEIETEAAIRRRVLNGLLELRWQRYHTWGIRRLKIVDGRL